MRDLELLIPIAFFVCITYAIKIIADARMRSKLITANGSEELMRSLVANEQKQNREASLRWGIVLTCLAGGFALIEAFNWDDLTPGAIAVLLGATGIGNLVFHWVAPRSPQ
jgi:hypothetical protein